MGKNHLHPDPFYEKGIMRDVPEVLGDKYRRIIENNYNYRERVRRMEMEPRTPLPGYARKDYDWTQDSACRDCEEPEVFFPEEDAVKGGRPWEKYCGDCPVRLICRRFGMRNKFDGIWGGAFLRHGKAVAVMPRGRPSGAPGRVPLVPLPDDLEEAVSEAVVTS